MKDTIPYIYIADNEILRVINRWVQKAGWELCKNTDTPFCMFFHNNNKYTNWSECNFPLRVKTSDNGIPYEEITLRQLAELLNEEVFRIDNHQVEFKDGYIKVGCTTISGETVEKIFNRLKGIK